MQSHYIIVTMEKTQRSYKSLVIGICLVLFGVFLIFRGLQKNTVTLGLLAAANGAIQIDVADTEASRVLGLSGRDSLSDDRGLLFVFDQPSEQHCFWMKDMKFTIDMVWFDENKQVIHTADNVSPQTYPEVFCPGAPAAYGLEVNSGRAAALGLYVGSSARF